MTSSARMLALLSMLQARRDWPGETLARRLDVSVRTVRRDVDRLRDLGYRIDAVKGPDGGYRLAAGSELPPLLFDDDQAVALAISLQAAPLARAGVDDAAARALVTLRQVMPERLRGRLDALRFAASPGDIGETDADPFSPAALARISAAIDSRERLRFDYRSPGRTGEGGGAHAPRQTDPHHLIAVAGRWYLCGWTDAVGDWRVYRVDRMDLRSHRGAPFSRREVPGDDPVAFLLARFRGSRDGAWPCRGRVRLSLPAHRVVAFAGDGTVEAIDDHTCVLEAGSWSWVALAASLGRFDADLTVIGPPELAAACAELAARYARAAAS